MKKILLIAIIAIFTALSFSCKKCITCSITWPNGTTDTTTYYDEYCDKKKEIERFEKNVSDNAEKLEGSYSCE
jgi:hypothetical protein